MVWLLLIPALTMLGIVMLAVVSARADRRSARAAAARLDRLEDRNT